MLKLLKKITRDSSLLLPPIAKLYRHRNELLSTVDFLNNHNAILQEKISRLEDNSFVKTRDIFNETYIEWLKIGVIGWCTDRNIDIIDQCVASLPAGAIIEIGSFCGLSMSIISHSLRMHNKSNRFFTIDDWYYEGYQQGAMISGAFTTDEWRAHTEEMFKLAVKLGTRNVSHSHIKKNSNEFFKYWEENASILDLNNHPVQLGGDIAFAYIDGDHSYEQSKKDFLNIDKFLVSGGYVFFDDSADNVGFGCKDVAKEVAKLPNYELVFQPADGRSNRCFIKKSQVLLNYEGTTKLNL